MRVVMVVSRPSHTGVTETEIAVAALRLHCPIAVVLPHRQLLQLAHHLGHRHLQPSQQP